MMNEANGNEIGVDVNMDGTSGEFFQYKFPNAVGIYIQEISRHPFK